MHSPKLQLCITIKEQVREKKKNSPLLHFCIVILERMFPNKIHLQYSFIVLKNEQYYKIKFQTKLKLNFKHTKFNKIDLTMKIKILLGLPPKKLLSLMSLAKHLLQNIFLSAKFFSLFKIWKSIKGLKTQQKLRNHF